MKMDKYKFESRYDLGDEVMIVNDPEGNKRIITSIRFSLAGGLYYNLSTAGDMITVSEKEISTDDEDFVLSRLMK